MDSVQANKRHWDVWARCNWPYRAERLKLIHDNEPFMEKYEPKLAPYLRDIKGKRIIVLQFGDGLVMLDCAKKGAIVTGVDLSTEQVKMARDAAVYISVNVNLVEADCQSLPDVIPSDYFDLAVAECGILYWIEKPETWMKNVYRVLKNGGRLAFTDFHPLSQVTDEKDRNVKFKKSYFDQGPEVDRPEDKSVPPAIGFVWKLSDIINATIQAGFRIERVEEFYVEEEDKRIPLMPTDYLLVATKE